MTKDTETLDVYDQQVEKYVSVTADDANSKALRAFQDKLPANGKVLDFGCGPGHHSETLQANGFDVTAWDGSAEMVAYAKTRGLNAEQTNFSDLNAVSKFDGIWASFSLLHATKAEFAKHLLACHRALKPNGQLYLGMKLGTGEHRDSIGRLYAYYSHDELNAYLTDAGFTPDEHQSGSAIGLSGDVSPYIEIFAHA